MGHLVFLQRCSFVPGDQAYHQRQNHLQGRDRGRPASLGWIRSSKKRRDRTIGPRVSGDGQLRSADAKLVGVSSKTDLQTDPWPPGSTETKLATVKIPQGIARSFSSGYICVQGFGDVANDPEQQSPFKSASRRQQCCERSRATSRSKQAYEIINGYAAHDQSSSKVRMGLHRGTGPVRTIHGSSKVLQSRVRLQAMR